MLCSLCAAREPGADCRAMRETAMTLGTVLIIILVIALLGGFSGRFRGYGYGYGHSGMGLIGVILIVLLVLVLLRKL
jgi:Na+/melibiose symporter-like transporter